MAIKGLEQAIDNLSRVRKNAIPAASAMTINRVATTAIISLHHRLPGRPG
ncbi:phage minor tail protein [Escherichia coli]|nr:phage minor tail protein [Escherichia coli]